MTGKQNKKILYFSFLFLFFVALQNKSEKCVEYAKINEIIEKYEA
ncbi:hypothetical protein [Bacteroides sp. 51]|nr:hypothetical protein [Bacteroides sp. 51]